MKEQYGWITELKEILDNFPDAGTDYEEVALIKRIQTLVNKDVREADHALTKCEENTYLNMIRNEITDAVYEFTLAYMKSHRIPSSNFTLSRGVFNGRVMLSVHTESQDGERVNTHYLSYHVTHINHRKIIKEMTGNEYANDYWATQTMYDAFMDAKSKEPDWIRKYCTDIITALDSIKSRSLKKRAGKKKDIK